MELELTCLDRFSRPTTRDEIVAAITLLVSDLSDWGVRCQLWIAGEFLTTEPDPEVAKIAVVIEQEAFSILDIGLQNDILNNIDERGYHHRLEVVVVVPRKREDDDYDTVQSFLDDWAIFEQLSRGGWLRGMIVLRLGETDVGLRLLS